LFHIVSLPARMGLRGWAFLLSFPDIGQARSAGDYALGYVCDAPCWGFLFREVQLLPFE